MNTTFYTQDVSLRGFCIAHLLSMGFNVSSCDKIEKIDNIILNNNINCLLLDIDEKHINWIDLINNIKENKKTLGLFIIAITSHDNDNEYINNLIMKCGFNAILYKNNLFSSSINKIIPLLINYNKNDERRKFVRIKPHSNEKIGIEFKINTLLKNEISIIGQVIDISPEGVGIHLENKEDLKNVIENDLYINSLKIKIENKIFICDGFIVRKKDSKMAIKYIKTDNDFKNGLACYILKKINY